MQPNKDNAFRNPREKHRVLPFQNLSHDPDNTYFADGIQEEILTRLGQDRGFESNFADVHATVSEQAAQSAQIARQLGVSNILEGTVQKAGDQVRVTVQLIKAETDSHLWGETYDRKLIDIFGVESEIAKRIAEALHAKLTGREKQALAVKPTNDPEAYDAYLRGLAFDGRNYGAGYSADLASKVSGSYELAVKLDPNFALAWARLSRVKAESYSFLPLDRLLLLSAMQRNVLWRMHKDSNRTRLKPCSPWVGINSLCCAITGLPQPRSLASANCHQSTAGSLRPWAKLSGARNTRMKALPISSKPSPWTHVIWVYSRTRQSITPCFDDSQPRSRCSDRMLDIAPNDPDVMAAKAKSYQPQGNLPEAARLLPEINCADS